MTFAEFQARAAAVYEEVPDPYKEGVEGLEVLRKAVPHPTLPEVFTLGECLSEFYPSDFGGPGEVRSRVVLYYGSFLELSRTSDDWDWDEEIWETITHEIRHHLEHLASDDALEEMDYAEDQNFARREGEPFDPFFFRSGRAVEAGTWEVDGDVFVEREIPRRAGREHLVEVEWGGRTFRTTVDPAADVQFARLGSATDRGDLFAVLVRRSGPLSALRMMLTRSPVSIIEFDVEDDLGAEGE
jgi:hypothetical protein